MELMEYVDSVLCDMGGKDAKLYQTDPELRTKALQYDLHLLSAKVRHLGTDRNVRILGKIYEKIKEGGIQMQFYTDMDKVEKLDDGRFRIKRYKGRRICLPLSGAGCRPFRLQMAQLRMRRVRHQADQEPCRYRSKGGTSGRDIQTHHRQGI